MKYATRILVYPEGDTQEIEWELRFHQVVDVSGRPLRLPVASERMLAYRVFRVSNEETRNEHVTRYHLEQLYPDDLAAYAERG
ncbi:MAG TPA: hypothetical protein VKA06_06530 [Spirochaetia bacterium]|nr:hypothetical protein [Spirochaetia bacterium]